MYLKIKGNSVSVPGTEQVFHKHWFLCVFPDQCHYPINLRLPKMLDCNCDSTRSFPALYSGSPSPVPRSATQNFPSSLCFPPWGWSIQEAYKWMRLGVTMSLSDWTFQVNM